MALNPAGTTLVIGGTTLIVESLSLTITYEPFDRVEFDNTRLREVRTACGEKRLLGENMAGKPYQIVYGCSDQQAVPLVPNSETTFDLVKKRFKIRRFNITGAINTSASVNSLLTLASTHQNYLAEFAGYQARSTGDISYTDLYALRSLSFSYLTTTGVSMTGTALDATETNMLITSVSAETVLSIPTSNPSVQEFYKTYNITVENRIIQALRA